MTCSVEGCDRSTIARGWCNSHYHRWLRLGDPHADVPIGIVGHRLQPRQPCSVDWCDRPVHSYGLCTTHRRREIVGTDLDAPIQPRGIDLVQAVRRNVYIGADDACWPAKRLQPEGYGTLWALGTEQLAHRAAWAAFVSPLDPGLQLHHVCRNRACANPAHLQPVTQAEHAKLHAH